MLTDKSSVRVKNFLMYSAAAVALVATANPAPAFAQDSGTSVQGVEDIVVTARRKEERNQDVPVAITAFGNERIAQMNIVDTQSLQSSVPSLVVGANGQGSRDTQSPTIRGQGATFQASPGVAVYMAEAPLPGALTLSMQGGPGSYLDLQNVQVLKGPQGTLFGRNTTGGAVLLSPQKPVDRQEGYIQIQGGNYNDRELQFVFNTPIIEDKLLVRLAGEIVDRDGYTKDINFNKDRDDKHYWTGRLGVTWRPTEKIENYLMAYNTWSRNNGAGTVGKGFNLGAYGVPAPFGYNQCDSGPPTGPCSAYQQLVDEQNARGPRSVSHSVDGFSKIKTWGVTDIFDYQLTENLTIRNIASYAELQNWYTYDGDGYNSPSYDVNPFTGRSIPRDDFKQYSEELQLQGQAFDGRLDYVVGGFYFKNEPNGTQYTGAISVCPLNLYTACLDGGADGNGFANPNNGQSYYGVTSESYAAYAQGTYDLGSVAEALDGLRLTLGYRYTWDEVSGTTTSYKATPLDSSFAPDGFNFTCSSSGARVLTADECNFKAKLESSRPTWTAGLDYKLTPDMLIYGKVSRGYKAGGFNTYAVRPETRTFGPESVTSYELGTKSDFTVQNMPVRLNVTVFQTDYDKIQRAAGDFNAGVSGAQTLSTASARIRGIELESVVKPIKALELGLNYSHIDAEYTDFKFDVPLGAVQVEDCNGNVFISGAVADLTCLPMQYVSPNIVSVFGRYAFTPSMSLFVNYSWTDDQHTEALNLEKNQPGERLESYGLLNASFDWKGINDSNIDLSIFATNITDELYRTSNTDVYQTGSLGAWSTLYGEPRMVGARLRYNWGG